MSQQVLSRKRVKKTKNNLKKSVKKRDGGEREQGQRADRLFSFPPSWLLSTRAACAGLQAGCAGARRSWPPGLTGPCASPSLWRESLSLRTFGLVCQITSVTDREEGSVVTPAALLLWKATGPRGQAGFSQTPPSSAV